ncbi:hypothetical protein GF369_03810 [Candidatus Peregrinibacteria bacterium]|nr:hypothetical protein [Candidatus Peregrinibacteria bacterium]
MADKKRNPDTTIEAQGKTLEKRDIDRKQEEHEVRETKTAVGIEAGDIIEGAEFTTGNVSEKEKKKKESYAGSNGQAHGTQKGSKKKPYPSVQKMSSRVEKELKKEIRDLKKKVKTVMKKGGTMDAVQLNTLMARLRQLKEALASLAYATADAIKDMWHKYVKENK